MHLTIKNPEAYRLARAIADRTGETLTQAVTEAIRERYAKLQCQKGKASIEEILVIADRVSALIEEPYLDHSKLLYDGMGLPK